MPSATPTSAEIAASIEHAEFGQFGKGVEAVTFLTASLIRAGAAQGRRRVRVLADQIAQLISPSAKLLDVGCGDGLLACEIKLRRPDVEVAGIDVLVRSHTHVAVAPFDGRNIPHGDGAFESVMMVDVRHHTDDPVVLLREAARVARREVILKDHTMNTRLSGSILRFMDDVGNERHGVNIVYNYWPTERWRTAFSQLQLEVADWIPDPALYPWPASLVFGRGLHFVARLTRRGAA
jgi:SAM-dependent methyltransferase